MWAPAWPANGWEEDLVKSQIVVFATMLATALFCLPAYSGDISRCMVYDCPMEQVAKQYGVVPGSRLTHEDSVAVTSFRFDGDTLKILVIPVEWLDKPNTRPAIYPKEAFDTMFFSQGVRPTGSVVEYFEEVSYGQLAVEGEVTDWYNAGSFEQGFDVLEAALPALDPVIDYSQYDGNGDGRVDGVVFICAGNARQDSQNDNDP